jgi:hypothetical protein
MRYVFLSISIFCCMSCSSPKPALILSGTYGVGDYQMANHLSAGSPGGRELASVLGTARPDFRFSHRDNKDSVYILPSLGMRYFGDSVFRFKVVADTLILENGNNVRKLPIVTDLGIVRIFGISHDIDHISIIPVKEL